MDIEKYLQSGKLEQYVLGLSSVEDRKEVEQLAKKFPEIDAYICELHSCMNSCSESNEIPVSKEPKHKSTCKTFHLYSKRNLNAEQADDSFEKTRSISWSTGIASFFVISLSTLTFFLYQGQQNTKSEMALLNTQLHHYKIENEKMVQQHAVLKDANTRLVNLHGKNASQTHGIVYWNKDHAKAYLSICNLPDTPEGHQFCVWADNNGKHQNVGVLDGESVEILHDLSFIKDCKGFCITLEEEGKITKPTIEKMLVKGEM